MNKTARLLGCDCQQARCANNGPKPGLKYIVTLDNGINFDVIAGYQNQSDDTDFQKASAVNYSFFGALLYERTKKSLQ